MRRLLDSSLPLCLIGILTAQDPFATARPESNGVDPALFAGLEYRLVGPSRGGRVTAVTGVPGHDRTFYMGAASGGVFCTKDGGESWTPITDGFLPVGSIGCIAVADSDRNVIYIGTGSDGVRSNVSTGRGVYRSGDGGETWQFAGLYDAGQIGAVRIHPTDANTVWVAANGDVFKPNEQRGIFKTIDGGKTWEHVLKVSAKTGAMDVELQPFDPDIVYAWMSHVERKPWTIISGSREGGFYKSIDGGKSWKQIGNGLPSELIGKGNLAVTAAKPERIYALIEAKPGGGLYRSDDAGESWKLVNDDSGLIQRPFYYTTLGADPTNADVVYAGAEGFYKSIDGGSTMKRFRTPHGDNHDIWVSPADGKIMIQANDGGANVSYDGGQTWSTQGNQPTSEIYAVWVDNGFPYKLYGAQQDNSTIIISSFADPRSTADWTTGPGCETGPIIPHPTDPDVVYGACKGKFEWMNMRTGLSKAYWIGVESLYGSPPRELRYRIQRTAPMETSVHDPETVYFGSQYVHRTRDRGVHWEQISPDLTWNPPDRQEPSGGPITRDATGEEIYSTLYQIRESILERGVIWVGANDGPFHITRDDGKTWTNITPKDLPPGGRVQTIEPSPHRKGSAFYATYRYLLGDYHPYIYRTDDYGATWSLLTDGKNGIPADWPTRTVREDPDREGLLYAGTEFGMFLSFDNGAQWQPFHLNMPHVPITDIKVHRQDLVVSTQGRAFWILDNISSLHQLTAQSAPDKTMLYTPRPGYRSTVGAGRLMPTVEYHLPRGSRGVVAIDILDMSGEVVNSYSSVASAASGARSGRQPRPADPMLEGRAGEAGGERAERPLRTERSSGEVEADEAESGEGRPQGRSAPGRARGNGGSRVTTKEGHNRFVWDCRHRDRRMVPPGRYTVVLKIGEAAWTQPLTLLIDPRLAADGVTDADLAAQFALADKVAVLMSDTDALVARVRKAKADGASDDEHATAIAALAGELLPEAVRYGRPGLQAQVRYFAGLARRTDQTLGRDVLERFAELRKAVDVLRDAADRALRQR